jgi:hypothetical protein
MRAALDAVPQFKHMDLACTEFYSISRTRRHPPAPAAIAFERRAAAATVQTYATMQELALPCRIRLACYFQAFGWSATLDRNDLGLTYTG